MTSVYIYIMLVSIIVFFSYINSLHSNTIEQFISFKEIYRPYVRRTRVFGEKIYDNVKSKLGKNND